MTTKDYMYLRSDLRLLLAAIALTAQSGSHTDEYAAGFEAALTSVAVGVGLVEAPAVRGRHEDRGGVACSA